ncbi:hypothetical protein NA78x_006112 [Anatilimnocola sp. NA78]|uniref:hypothetical protein n=1 Tax=Anatilimnocola sp. NA78 TaxID=3415683 RepID=UPI003CE4E4E7
MKTNPYASPQESDPGRSSWVGFEHVVSVLISIVSIGFLIWFKTNVDPQGPLRPLVFIGFFLAVGGAFALPICGLVELSEWAWRHWRSR